MPDIPYDEDNFDFYEDFDEDYESDSESNLKIENEENIDDFDPIWDEIEDDWDYDDIN